MVSAPLPSRLDEAAAPSSSPQHNAYALNAVFPTPPPSAFASTAQLPTFDIFPSQNLLSASSNPPVTAHAGVPSLAAPAAYALPAASCARPPFEALSLPPPPHNSLGLDLGQSAFDDPGAELDRLFAEYVQEPSSSAFDVVAASTAAPSDPLDFAAFLNAEVLALPDMSGTNGALNQPPNVNHRGSSSSASGGSAESGRSSSRTATGTVKNGPRDSWGNGRVLPMAFGVQDGADDVQPSISPPPLAVPGFAPELRISPASPSPTPTHPSQPPPVPSSADLPQGRRLSVPVPAAPSTGHPPHQQLLVPPPSHQNASPRPSLSPPVPRFPHPTRRSPGAATLAAPTALTPPSAIVAAWSKIQPAVYFLERFEPTLRPLDFLSPTYETMNRLWAVMQTLNPRSAKEYAFEMQFENSLRAGQGVPATAPLPSAHAVAVYSTIKDIWTGLESARPPNCR
ncbi:hypothetical protein JCM8097_007519 [Rhodosporidiobolus ruineniae]